jgi:hypothetical protein
MPGGDGSLKRTLRPDPRGLGDYGPKPLGQGAHDGKGDVRPFVDHGLELSIPDVQGPDVALGNKGGDMRRPRDHRHLAHDLSCAPSCDRLAVRTDDADGAVEQDVHLLAQLALGTDDVAVRVGVLLGDLGDTLQVGGPFTYGAAVGAGDDFVG